MKIWMRICLLCLLVYIAVISTAGIVIVERNYDTALQSEIKYSISLEENMQAVVHTLAASQNFNINWIQSIFNEKDLYIEVYDSNLKRETSNHFYVWKVKRDELKAAMDGRIRYVLRNINDKHYLFVAALIGENKILSIAKDITYIDIQRKDQYTFFIRLLIVGVVLMILVVPVISRYITGPIVELTKSVEKMISGNYKQKIPVRSKDEIGALAQQFNIMAGEIGNRINQLQEEAYGKQRFIDNLMHELRTPLTSIIGYSEILGKMEYDKKIFNKALANIFSEGKRISEMSNKLMQMTLLNNGGVRTEEFSAGQLLEDAAASLKFKLDSSNIKLKLEITEMNILADYDLIKGVMINVIDNSIKASLDGRTIIVGSEFYKDRKCLFVKDEGKGIPEEELNKIFEPFYRVDKSRSRAEGGVGLGLSICSEIVKAHNAEIKIQSEVGEGTVVKILF